MECYFLLYIFEFTLLYTNLLYYSCSFFVTQRTNQESFAASKKFTNFIAKAKNPHAAHSNQ